MSTEAIQPEHTLSLESDRQETTEAQEWYVRLDRFLLFWTAGEAGYLLLLLIAVVIFVIIGFTDSSLLGNSPEAFILWPIVVLVVALLGNIIMGFAGLVLNILTKHHGYPGTGHLLNWILIFASFWLFVVLFVIALPSAMYSIF